MSSLKRKSMHTVAASHKTETKETKAVRINQDTKLAKSKVKSVPESDELESTSYTSSKSLPATDMEGNDKKASKFNAFGAALGALIAQTSTPTSKPKTSKQSTSVTSTSKSSDGVEAKSSGAEKLAKAKEKTEKQRELERKRKAQGLGPLKQGIPPTDDDHKPLAVAKALKAERKRNQQRKLLLAKDHVTPESNEHEKTLLRIATKGMVALFNAVAQQQRRLAELAKTRDLDEADDSDGEKIKEVAKVGLAAKLRQKAALETKTNTASTKVASAKNQQSRTSFKASAQVAYDDSEDEDSELENVAKASKSTNKISARDREASGTGWKVFDEDYLVNKKQTGWAHSDSESEDDV